MREEAWVESLRRRFPFSRGLGIGDDAAVLAPDSRRESLVLTTDMLVEGVHFRKGDLTPAQLALKSLAVNLSDLAAMGARPLFYTLALALPADYMGLCLEEFYDGLEQGNRRWGVELAGGDLSAGSILTISITAVGEAARPVLRSGSRVGDLLAVCGRLGWSKLGLHDLLNGQRKGPFAEAHISVEPLLAQGQTLGPLASAMMDLSDGLLKDLGRLCSASGLDAEIDAAALPLDRVLSDRCRTLGWSPLETVLVGGEDYALLFTAGVQEMAKIKTLVLEPDISVIGRMVPGGGQVRVFENGRERVVEVECYDHFAVHGAGD
jgi:thiamine-monophosphate kinase